MKIGNKLKSMLLGLKRHPWRFIVSIFLSYSALWTIKKNGVGPR
jgi:hypothetical protein